MPDAIAKLAALFEAVRKYSEENEPIREKDLAEYRELSYRLMPRILDVLRAGENVRSAHAAVVESKGNSLKVSIAMDWMLRAVGALANALDALLAQPTGSDGGDSAES